MSVPNKAWINLGLIHNFRTKNSDKVKIFVFGRCDILNKIEPTLENLAAVGQELIQYCVWEGEPVTVMAVWYDIVTDEVKTLCHDERWESVVEGDLPVEIRMTTEVTDTSANHLLQEVYVYGLSDTNELGWHKGRLVEITTDEEGVEEYKVSYTSNIHCWTKNYLTVEQYNQMMEEEQEQEEQEDVEIGEWVWISSSVDSSNIVPVKVVNKFEDTGRIEIQFKTGRKRTVNKWFTREEILANYDKLFLLGDPVVIYNLGELESGKIASTSEVANHFSIKLESGGRIIRHREEIWRTIRHYEADTIYTNGE